MKKGEPIISVPVDLHCARDNAPYCNVHAESSVCMPSVSANSGFGSEGCYLALARVTWCGWCRRGRNDLKHPLLILLLSVGIFFVWCVLPIAFRCPSLEKRRPSIDRAPIERVFRQRMTDTPGTPGTTGKIYCLCTSYRICSCKNLPPHNPPPPHRCVCGGVKG